ncbi:UDP-N-acetylmuramoyl-L-alanyl-D-glutamate--2,6-diaminopimelate ligase [Clostridium oryzae]|uniref:UDP-N-acetylmuramoyl-L-alanyl-D-glutamate--2,6-diaminopimelate ligase n=1 Tax=Clostridium oryzae TaxID=1450648 RepID=A0A1V4IDV5_9CLOT|nr:UDP-N-acetylmuramoyl-L-alanyl-D-glutamate--2,6-diaminopimelate ligase [Clostridium oryzae]OPJ58133.1 UDP-N-acetylmuramoyl-L-alanyl-D-glutamate--LD-lysine ligase [Clostridium oryzae]
MKLSKLLTNIDYKLIQGSTEIEVENICWDSRNIKKSSLFICVKGKNVDRHSFANDAIEKGAIALVIEHDIENIPKHVTVVKVNDSKSSMAVIANDFFDHPSEKFKLVGITGTNGKTSTSYFLTELLQSFDKNTGLIGTIENKIGDKKLDLEKKNPTTPDSLDLQSCFYKMVEGGVTHVVMEATSIGLVNHRVDECDFDIGIFTNLTQDHLDEHGTMENYRDAKIKLFKMCKKGLINIDDYYAEDFIKAAECEVFTYGIDRPADYRAEDVAYSLEGSTFTLNYHGQKKEVSIKVSGKFNVYNSLAAIAACHQLGFPLDTIIENISSIHTVSGRFQTIPNCKGYMVVVDYAHTPDGIENILNSARNITKKKVISVFGCGGDRDKTKRPIMGQIAGKLSDYCVLTSDNPRTEEPEGIIKDIEKGIKATACPYIIEADRKKAIFMALEKSRPGDIIVIAGKGHETYQIFKDKTIHFDDVEVVKEYLKLTSYVFK